MTTTPTTILLNHLHRGGNYAYYWRLEDKQSLWFATGDRPAVPASWENSNVYFGVHPTNAKGQHDERSRCDTIAAINCLFAEFDVKDYGSKESILTHLDKLPLYPSAIVDSGGGFHAYWILEDTVTVIADNRQHISNLQAAWVAFVCGDDGAKDLARVLRLPGTQNRKPHFAPNFPTVSVYKATFTTYSLSEFEQFVNLDDVGKAATAAQRQERPATSASGDDVIRTFNDSHSIIALLVKHGYTLVREWGQQARLRRPDGASPSVQVSDNRSYHHSSSDPLHSTHTHDAFDIFTLLDHSGDQRAAYEAAKREQGKWVEKTTPGALDPVIESIQHTEPDEPEPRHPLDTTTHANLNLGWISEYEEIASTLTGTQRSFHRLAGLHCVSLATQAKAFVRVQFAPSGIYPNVFSSNVAISGFGKGTVVSMARYILKEATLDRLFGPSHFTSEGLLDHLSGKPNTIVFRNEVATLFSSDQVKHTKDLKMDLADLYDCTPFERKLSQREVKVDLPFLNLVGSTTPDQFYGSVKHTDFTSGLMPRFLFALADENEKPDFRKASGLYTDSHESTMKKLAWRLASLESQRKMQFSFVGEALPLWVEWQAQSLDYAYDLKDRVSLSILRRYNIYALKFATLLAAVNDSWGVITPEMMDTSIKLADNYKAVMYRVLMEGNKHRLNGSDAFKVFSKIRQLMTTDEGATMRRIIQFTNLDRATVEPYLKVFMNSGEVSEKTEGRVKRYITTLDSLKPRDWGRVQA